MKIVIDIPERVYNTIQKSFSENYPDDIELLFWIDTVRNGTPLPKGHGDLIDRKELIDSPYRKGGLVEWYDEIKYASAIVPADKEESE